MRARRVDAVDVVPCAAAVTLSRAQVNAKRCLGNAWVARSDIPRAIRRYGAAIEIGDSDYDITDEDEKKRLREAVAACKLNRAMCHLKVKNYADCLKDCSDVLEIDPACEAIKLQAPFNSGSLAVGARCCSLYAVEGIYRRSCPSLGLSDDRGAEIARRDDLTHWLISTQDPASVKALFRQGKCYLALDKWDAVWKSTSELPRHRTDAVTATTSRRWRRAPDV